MEELRVKGIILSAAMTGEDTRRLSILTDKLGRISAFASGGAKQSSHLIGKLRPFTAAVFTLIRGKSAYRIRGVELMRSFSEIPLDPERFIYGSYVLETAEYFSREGMDERDAVMLLNLIYLTLDKLENIAAAPARHDDKYSPDFIRAVYELRLLVIDGSYEEEPGDETAASLYRHAVSAPLSRLFDAVPYTEDEKKAFIAEVRRLFRREAGRSFKTGDILLKMQI